MLICITSISPNLDSPIDPRFGRAQFFLILDEKGNLKESLPNPGIGAFHGAGITAAQTIAAQKIGVLITGNIGPNACGVLMTAGIKIFLVGPGLTVRKAFLMWKENKLTQIQTPTVPGHFNPESPGASGPAMGPGMGPGMGSGRGRGGRGRGGR